MILLLIGYITEGALFVLVYLCWRKQYGQLQKKKKKKKGGGGGGGGGRKKKTPAEKQNKFESSVANLSVESTHKRVN